MSSLPADLPFFNLLATCSTSSLISSTVSNVKRSSSLVIISSATVLCTFHTPLKGLFQNAKIYPQFSSRLSILIKDSLHRFTVPSVCIKTFELSENAADIEPAGIMQSNPNPNPNCYANSQMLHNIPASCVGIDDEKLPDE